MDGSHTWCIAFYRIVQRSTSVRIASIRISSCSQEGFDDPSHWLVLFERLAIAHPSCGVQRCPATLIGNSRISARAEEAINRVGVEVLGSINQRMALGTAIVVRTVRVLIHR